MIKNLLTVVPIIFSTVLFIGVPNVTSATGVDFKVVPNDGVVDTATVVEVRLGVVDKNINAIDGILKLQKSPGVVISTVVVETGGSSVTFWPLTPEYYPDEGVIRFAGGNPTGFNKEDLLFRIRIFTSKPGNATLSWIGGSAYMSDGYGTIETVSSRSILISLASSAPNPINSASADSIPPYFDIVEVGKDPDVFDGKYFVSFHAIDNLSGLDRYEVVEDQVVTKVENGIYILNDQERKSRVIVIAYDKAGNSESIKVPAKYDWVIYLTIVVLSVLVVGLFIIRKRFAAR